MPTIGDRIRERREARGMTPTELAAKVSQSGSVSMTPQAIYQIEDGTTKNPKPANVLAIADALDEDVIFLISGERRSVATSVQRQPAGYISPEEMTRLITLYAGADQEGRRMVMAMAEAASTAERRAVDDQLKNG